LLSTASDEAARIWDTAIGECVGVLAGHEGWVWSGAFAPDGRSAATGDGNGTIKLWSIPHPGAETSFERPLTPCRAIAYSSDEGSLFTATAAGPLEAWDPSTGSFRGVLPLRPAGAPVEAAFAPGAEMVALADAEGTLTVGGPRKARPDFTITRATAARACLTFSADGKTLAYVDGDGDVARLDATGREPRPSALGSLPSSPTCLAFAPDGVLLAGDADGRLFAFGGDFDAATEAAERGHRGRIRALAFAPDGSLCATGGEDASIVIWDRPALRIHARLVGHERAIDALAFTRDGRSIVSIAEGVQLWNVATARPTIRLATRIEGSTTPGRLAISTDGTSIAVLVREPGTLQGRVWHAARPDSQE
jgi:WD40 repeat protein